MTSKPGLSAQALIIATGPLTPKIDEIVAQGLSPFVHESLQTQRIDLGGRTIFALQLQLDPAHFEAIENELTEIGNANGLDIAMELI